MPSRGRKRRSGAAMVEGIVVISTMLCFLGLITYARQAYGTKLDLQQQTRSETFFFASHGCEGGGEANSESGGAIGVDQPAPKAANGGGEGASSATRNWNNASKSDERDISVSAIFDQNAKGKNDKIQYGKESKASHISASSNCTCNEPKYNSQLTAWFSFGKDMLQRGGGIADLFK